MADKEKAGKEKKVNLFEKAGKRVVKFFSELRAELKKVVWPDRKKLTQSTIAVVAICIFAAVLIFSVDKILSGFLGAVKFFPETESSIVATSNLIPTMANPTVATSTVTSTQASVDASSTAVSSVPTAASSASSASSSN